MGNISKKNDANTSTALSVVEQETLVAESHRQRQSEREQMIARSYEMAGQIKAVKMMSKFGDVTSLMWLKQVKESQIFHDLPNIGTWENYCKYLGLDRHSIDQKLLNLSVFGADFMETVTSLQVGYRELRKLRQLTHDGTIVIDAEGLKIGDETIPLSADRADDLQSAIDGIIAEKATLNDRITKLEKHKDEIVKEETKGLQSERDIWAKEAKRLKAFEPAENDREWSVKMMATIEDATLKLEMACRRFVMDERLVDDPHLQAKVESHLTQAELQLQGLRVLWTDKFYRDTDGM